MTSRARALRDAATPEERLLWTRLRHLRPRFTRQLPIGSYIVDFACRTVKVAVELDGGQHIDAAAYDAERTAFLERSGWRVLRFWNSEVRDNPDGVAEVIGSAVAFPSGEPTPNPSLSGRGDMGRSPPFADVPSPP